MRRCALAALLLSVPGCAETPTETIVRSDTVVVVDTVVVRDTVTVAPAVWRATLIASGLGPISGHLTDASASSHGILVADQRGVVQTLAGETVLTVQGAARESAFGGLLGIVEVAGVLYVAYTTPETEPPYAGAQLVLADEHGRSLWRSAPYRIFPAQGVVPRNYGGGLAAYGGRILLGYGHGAAPAGPGDPRAGGILSIDPATGVVDTIAVGLRSPWKLAVEGDDLFVSSPGELTWDAVYRMRLDVPGRVDFGFPRWEGPLCHTEPDCPPAAPPWFVVPQSEFGCTSLLGGAVFEGEYWFTDLCEAWVRSTPDGRMIRHHFDLPGRISGVRNVGGRLLVIGYDGGKVWEVRR